MGTKRTYTNAKRSNTIWYEQVLLKNLNLKFIIFINNIRNVYSLKDIRLFCRYPVDTMIVISCTLLHSDGTIEPKTFKVTESKLQGIQEKGPKQVDAFLRTKVAHKGYYGSWKRYGSWTLHDEPAIIDSNTDQCTYLYAWAYSRGTVAHSSLYNLNQHALVVYDDVLLLRVPDLNHLDIARSMAISNDQVNGWLQCICSVPSSVKVVKDSKNNKKKTNQLDKKRKTRPKKTKTKTSRMSKLENGKDIEQTAVFEVEEESLLKEGGVSSHFKLNEEDEADDDDVDDDDDDDDDDASCSGVGDITAGSSNVSNGQSDDEEDDDDDDDVMDGPIDTALFGDDEVDNVEEEDDDDDETSATVDVLEAQMLQYEDYDYMDKTISCQLPSLYSLWTSSSTFV